MRETCLKGAAEESLYLLEYEKQRIETCAKSFEELAKVFVYLPAKEGDEAPEVQDRKTILWKKRLMENRELFADNLKEMASIMGQVAGKSDTYFRRRRVTGIRHLSFEKRRRK